MKGRQILVYIFSLVSIFCLVYNFRIAFISKNHFYSIGYTYLLLFLGIPTIISHIIFLVKYKEKRTFHFILFLIIHAMLYSMVYIYYNSLENLISVVINPTSAEMQHERRVQG